MQINKYFFHQIFIGICTCSVPSNCRVQSVVWRLDERIKCQFKEVNYLYMSSSVCFLPYNEHYIQYLLDYLTWHYGATRTILKLEFNIIPHPCFQNKWRNISIAQYLSYQEKQFVQLGCSLKIAELCTVNMFPQQCFRTSYKVPNYCPCNYCFYRIMYIPFTDKLLIAVTDWTKT